MNKRLSEAQRRRVETVFGDAADLPTEQRDEYVRAECGDDAAVRAEVLALLAALNDGTLAELNTGAMTQQAASVAGIPTRIGAFEIVRPLGDGGFGTVWLAQQQAPVQRDVAIKLIKPGMDSAEVLRRFERERQTLAQLDHPHIARIIEAGETAQQRPYFAMDYVAGEPITTYCDAARLSITARIEVFLQACAAVQHAHQKGVIHRDLKPSNVLVAESDGKPHARVIDFGIARALADVGDQQLTRPATIVGTPAYMSPEQSESPETADTRTDVYSLGVLLFQLLAGALPYEVETRVDTPDQLAERIRARRVVSPSSRVRTRTAAIEAIATERATQPRKLRKSLRGELDWIVLKALAPERERRYATVAEFAEDLRRYLHREPVSAGPLSTGYKVRKFVQRNRGLVVSGGVVALVVVGALVGVSAALQRALAAEQSASLARDEAQAQAARAASLNEFLIDDILAAASPEYGGYELTVVEAIANGLETVDERFAEHPRQHATIRYTIGKVYQQLGLIEQALTQLRLAREILATAAGDSDSELVVIDGALGNALLDVDQLDEAEPVLRDAYARAGATLGAEHEETLQIARSLGEALQKLGKHDEAQTLLKHVIATRRSQDGLNQAALFAALSSLAASYSANGQEQAASALASEIHAAAVDVFPRTHPARLAALNNFANVLMDEQRHEEAAAQFAELIDAVGEALPAEHWQQGLARYGYARALIELNRLDDAIAPLKQAFEILRNALGPTHYFTELTLSTLYRTLDRAGLPDEALRYHRLALETRLLAAPPDQRARVAQAWREYLERLRSEGMDDADATARARDELAAHARVLLSDGDTLATRFARNLGAVLMEAGLRDDALHWLQTALERAQETDNAEGTAEIERLLEELGSEA